MSYKINGIGGRIHAVEQAESLLHLADELERDLWKWTPQPGGELAAAHVLEEVAARVARLRAEGAELRAVVRAYDLTPRGLTPGEIDSMIGVNGRNRKAQ